MYSIECRSKNEVMDVEAPLLGAWTDSERINGTWYLALVPRFSAHLELPLTRRAEKSPPLMAWHITKQVATT
jgi:hypothetical protein